MPVIWKSSSSQISSWSVKAFSMHCCPWLAGKGIINQHLSIIQRWAKERDQVPLPVMVIPILKLWDNEITGVLFLTWSIGFYRPELTCAFRVHIVVLTLHVKGLRPKENLGRLHSQGDAKTVCSCFLILVHWPVHPRELVPSISVVGGYLWFQQH